MKRYFKSILNSKFNVLIINKENISLIGIFIVAAFLRFYNYPLRYGFDYDATRDALVSISGSSNFQLPLVGPPSSVGPFHFGPWYYYQLILANILIPFDYAPWVYMSVISLFFIFVIYKIGVLLEGKGFGLLLAALAAISPDQIGRANGLTNPNLVGVSSALAIWFFIALLQKQQGKWSYFFWGLVIGIGINNHFQMLGLLVLPLIFFVYIRKHIVTLLPIFAGGLFVAFIPMLIFNLTYYWHTVRMIIYYLLYMRNLTHVPNRWLTYATDFWPTYTGHILGVPTLLIILLHVGLFICIGVLLYKRKLQVNYTFLLIAYGLNFLVLRYYGGERLYHNFNYLQPLLFIFTGFVVYNLLKNQQTKLAGVAVLILLLLFPLQEDIRRLNPLESHTLSQNKVAEITKVLPSQTYTLYNCTSKYDNNSQSLVLLLYYDNKLSKNGKKLGLVEDACFAAPQEGNKKYNRISYNSIDEIKTKYQYYDKLRIVDLGDTPSEELLAKGWSFVTPDSVYDSAARWWFYEKP